MLAFLRELQADRASEILNLAAASAGTRAFTYSLRRAAKFVGVVGFVDGEDLGVCDFAQLAASGCTIFKLRSSAWILRIISRRSLRFIECQPAGSERRATFL